MKRLALRSTLALAMLTCFLSSTQAGVIPWVYDVIFGPVRHPGYYGPANYGPAYSSPMSYGYARPCSPCASGWRTTMSYPAPRPRCSTGACPTSGCQTYAYYPTWPMGYALVSSPCAPRSACKAKVDWRASDVVDRKAPEPRDEDETTYAKDKQDPFDENEVKKPTGTGSTSAEGTAAEGSSATDEGAEKASGEGDDASTEVGKPGGFKLSPGAESKETNPGAASRNDASDFPPPKPGAAEESKEGKPGSGEAEKGVSTKLSDEESGDKPNFGEKPGREGESTKNDESKNGDAKDGAASEADSKTDGPLDGVSDKTTWKISRPVHRIAFRASFSNVRIARRSPTVEADYVIPAASQTRIAGR